jgi:hypothetical protein
VRSSRRASSKRSKAYARTSAMSAARSCGRLKGHGSNSHAELPKTEHRPARNTRARTVISGPQRTRATRLARLHAAQPCLQLERRGAAKSRAGKQTKHGLALQPKLCLPRPLSSPVRGPHDRWTAGFQPEFWRQGQTNKPTPLFRSGRNSIGEVGRQAARSDRAARKAQGWPPGFPRRAGLTPPDRAAPVRRPPGAA